MKTAGVIGGMGPAATVDFISKVIAFTDAKCDQDHVPLIVDHKPGVPNRQNAILLGTEKPSAAISQMGQRLQSAGADFLVMPCNSAHAFVGELEAKITIPLMSIVDATVGECNGVETVGLLATNGCLATRGYQNALSRRGIATVEPVGMELEELMCLITAVKSGERGAAIRVRLSDIANKLLDRGAEAIIAGCTEIPLVLDAVSLGTPVISSTDTLARITVSKCGGRLRVAST